MENKKTLPLKKKISNDSFATLKKFWKSQDSSTLALLCSNAKSQFIDNKAGLILLPFLKVSKIPQKVISYFSSYFTAENCTICLFPWTTHRQGKSNFYRWFRSEILNPVHP